MECNICFHKMINFLYYSIPFFSTSILKSLAIFIDKHLKLVKNMLDHLPAIEHEANKNEASIKTKLLVSQAKFLTALVEKLKAQDRLVEDIRLRQITCLTHPLVLAVIKLHDLGRNCTDLSALEPHLHQFLQVPLLKLPQFCVKLEGLVKIRVVHALAIG
jgi:hypothetical protein